MSPAISRLLVVAAAFALLGVSACKTPNGSASQAGATQTAPEAPVASKASESALPASTEPAPAGVAKQAEAVPEANVAPKAAIASSEAKLPTAAPTATPPAATTPPPAAAVAKPAVMTKDQALALASKGNCLACHKIEIRVVGPAWKDVAAKYRGDANAVSTITAHIKSGGSFGWKFGVMPPRGGSNISDADVANLAKFIASLK